MTKTVIKLSWKPSTLNYKFSPCGPKGDFAGQTDKQTDGRKDRQTDGRTTGFKGVRIHIFKSLKL